MKKLEDNAGAATPKSVKKSDNVIIPKKEINYIETMYLYYTHKFEYEEWYQLVEHLANNYSSLGSASGRTWYVLENGSKIGIFESYEKCISSKQYFVVLQYEFEQLFLLEGDLDLLSLPEFLSNDQSKYYFKRVDITKVAQYEQPLELDPLFTNFITPFGYNYYEGTVYLGSRKNGCVTRIYNKTLELQEQSSHKEKYFLKHFDNLENLYTIELELHRSYLRKNFKNVQKLSDWRQLSVVYNLIVGSIKMFEINDKNMKNYKNNNKNRIPFKTFTGYEFMERNEKVKYSRSYKRFIKKLTREIDIYFEIEEIPKTNRMYMQVYEDLMRERLQIDGKDMVISFEETELSEDIKAFNEKMDRIRYKGHDFLEMEAEKYIPLPKS